MTTANGCPSGQIAGYGRNRSVEDQGRLVFGYLPSLEAGGDFILYQGADLDNAAAQLAFRNCGKRSGRQFDLIAAFSGSSACSWLLSHGDVKAGAGPASASAPIRRAYYSLDGILCDEREGGNEDGRGRSSCRKRAGLHTGVGLAKGEEHSRCC